MDNATALRAVFIRARVGGGALSEGGIRTRVTAIPRWPVARTGQRVEDYVPST